MTLVGMSGHSCLGVARAISTPPRRAGVNSKRPAPSTGDGRSGPLSPLGQRVQFVHLGRDRHSSSILSSGSSGEFVLGGGESIRQRLNLRSGLGILNSIRSVRGIEGSSGCLSSSLCIGSDSGDVGQDLADAVNSGFQSSGDLFESCHVQFQSVQSIIDVVKGMGKQVDLVLQ
jgi:hypothetical protein